MNSLKYKYRDKYITKSGLGISIRYTYVINIITIIIVRHFIYIYMYTYFMCVDISVWIHYALHRHMPPGISTSTALVWPMTMLVSTPKGLNGRPVLQAVEKGKVAKLISWEHLLNLNRHTQIDTYIYTYIYIYTHIDLYIFFPHIKVQSDECVWYMFEFDHRKIQSLQHVPNTEPVAGSENPSKTRGCC